MDTAGGRVLRAVVTLAGCVGVALAQGGAAPEMPLVRLIHNSKTFQAEPGSGCWPRDEGGGIVSSVCWDKEFVVPERSIAVAPGDRLTVRVQAETPPRRLTAAVFETAGRGRIARLDLEPKLTGEFVADYPPGDYVVHLFGDWTEGNIYFAFRLKIV
jgi:hypothetical protein